MPKRNYTVIGISLPDEAWNDVNNQQEEWGTSGRSATVLRIIEEWKALRQALAAQKGENSNSKIIVIAT